MLCKEYPVAYVIKPDSGVTEEWILENVMPGIYAEYRNKKYVAVILGKALLWTIFLPHSDWVYSIQHSEGGGIQQQPYY